LTIDNELENFRFRDYEKIIQEGKYISSESSDDEA